jgi:hypothetical protein
MSHTCPECGMICFCNGDIDDCEFSGGPEQLHCIHWKKCERDDDLDLPPEED